MLRKHRHKKPFVHKRTLILFSITGVLFLLLIGFILKLYFTYANASGMSASEQGIILNHGQTYSDYWSDHATTPWVAQGNRPPVDGSIKTWSFYPNGDQIVTKGDDYWTLSSGQNTWVGPQSLKAKWASCSTFPTTGIDAYSIYPGSTISPAGYEFAFVGTRLFAIDKNNNCTINGQDWKAQWQSASSPSGNYPFKSNTHIDQFQWLDANNQVIYVNNQMWLIGADDKKLACATPSSITWHFCEPETLDQRIVARFHSENHPPTDKIGIFAVMYAPGYQAFTSNPQIFTYKDYIWTLGENGLWNVYRSGPDGYGAREPFLMQDTDSSGNPKYFLYYDGLDANKDWVTMVATAANPTGPWKKEGEIMMTGTKRSWETSCSCAATVFKVNGKYYDFYLGANTYMAPPSTSQPGLYRVPWENNYYSLGLAVSDSPYGPFRRVNTNGSLLDAASSDSPLLSGITTPSYRSPNSNVSSQGSLITQNGKWYYSVSAVMKNGLFGSGMLEANDIAGPWTDSSSPPNPLVNGTESFENPQYVYDSQSGYYFLFGNAIYDSSAGIWKDLLTSCEVGGNYGQGVGLVMYWSKDLFSWDALHNKQVLASGNKSLGCTNNEIFTPGAQNGLHQGAVGLGSPLLDATNRKVYVAFDGNNFETNFDANINASNTFKNHMFRDIYLLTLDIGSFSPQTNLPQTNSAIQGTISGPDVLAVGQKGTYTITLNSPVSLSSIYAYTAQYSGLAATSQGWQYVGSGTCSGLTCSISVQWSSATRGIYTLVFNGFDNTNKHCTGNPFLKFTDAIDNSYKWEYCGPTSQMQISVR